ncbi:hypothetical protein ACQP3F_26625, partial [Escherichia coli]
VSELFQVSWAGSRMTGPSFLPSIIMEILSLRLGNIENIDVEFSKLLLFDDRALTNFGGPENIGVLPHPGVPSWSTDIQSVWH